MPIQFLTTLFPPCCIACEKEGALLCGNCTRTLTLIKQSCLYCDAPSYYGQTCSTCRHEDHIDGHVTCFGYGPVLRTCINALKYQGVQSLGQYLGTKIGYALCDHPLVKTNTDTNTNTPMFIPVPSHRRKQYFTRGYTQTVPLAQGVQQVIGGTVQGILTKKNYTRSQVSANKSQRLYAIQGSFSINTSFHKQIDSIPPVSTIIIIDDITTTGATIRETGKILRQQFPTHQIWGVSLARNR